MPYYDLEERTLKFAIEVRKLIKDLPPNTINFEDGKQLVRSSGSVGANYIEANENIGAKNFLMHLKIARKEAKETIYWLSILKSLNDEKYITCFDGLLEESTALRKILSSIIIKQKSKLKK